VQKYWDRSDGDREYMVADLALSELGRKEIKIAEHEIPRLMAIREKHAAGQPLDVSE